MRPVRPCTAPVNAPRVCPNSSASSRASGIAAQFSATIRRAARGLSRCTACATSSFPLPVGPSISTAVDRGATSRIRRLTSSSAGCDPTNSGSRHVPLPSALHRSASSPASADAADESGKLLAFSNDPVTPAGFPAGKLPGAAFHAAPSPACARRSACSTSFRRGLRAPRAVPDASAITRSTPGCSRSNSVTNSCTSRSGSHESTTTASAGAASRHASVSAPPPASRTCQRSSVSASRTRWRNDKSALTRIAVRIPVKGRC